MNENGKFVIAVDFDGTIVEQFYPEIGELKENAKKVINKLYDEGHTIIIWTCRCNAHDEIEDLTNMKYFLEFNGIKYHKINENADCVTFGCKPKIYADVYVDDRNLIHTDNWDLVYSLIQSKLTGENKFQILRI